MIFLHVTREWHEKFVQKFTCHTRVNVKFKLSCTVYSNTLIIGIDLKYMTSKTCIQQIKYVIKLESKKTYFNTITTVLIMLCLHSNKLNTETFLHWRILKIPTKSCFCLPACLPTGTDYIAFKLIKNKQYFRLHQPLLFQSQHCCVPSPVLCSFILTN